MLAIHILSLTVTITWRKQEPQPDSYENEILIARIIDEMNDNRCEHVGWF
ncbi:YrzI family small protein [Effusibacillus lacus]|nr:YrzI family small protein [Effusibacillus lacus]TCS72542.1 putative sporulation protein YrzI [Effusibacillus lacus]